MIRTRCRYVTPATIFVRSSTLVLTMTFNSPSEPSSILEGGELKAGIYKIQNLFAQTYLDIHEHSRELCCRPAEKLAEGRGLVRPFPRPPLCASDDYKWELKHLGAGYSVRRVSAPVWIHGISTATSRTMHDLD